MDKSNKVLILSIIVMMGFVMAVIYHYILGSYLDKPYPYNTFLWPSKMAFQDFTDFLPAAKNLNPFGKIDAHVNYFPLAYLILFPFAFITNKMASYLCFTSIFLFVFTYMNIKNFSCENLTRLQNFQNIFILTTASYPLITLLDRGNFDMMLFVLFVVFIYSFNSKQYLMSAMILAVMNAIKPFSLIFLVLFLFKKKFKYLLLSTIVSFALIMGSFMVLKGNFFDQISTLIVNLSTIKSFYVYENFNHRGMFAGSSLFMALKLLFTRFTISSLVLTPVLSKFYTYLSLLITAIVVFFGAKEKIFWKQISLLSLYMLLMPYITNDYKLIFLFVPIWLFVNAKEKTKFDLAYAILFGLLLIPKNIIIPYSLANLPWWFSASILINPLIIMIFMGLIIFEQFSKKQIKEGNNEY